MGSLAVSSASHGLFGDPLWVFSILSPCTYSSEVGILSWFSMFADSIACVLQHQEKLRGCPSNPAWPSCWAGLGCWGLLGHFPGLGSSLPVNRIYVGGPLGGLLGGGHSPGACSHHLEVPPNPDMSGLLLQPGKVGNLDPPLYFSFYSHLNSNSSFISSH